MYSESNFPKRQNIGRLALFITCSPWLA